MASTAHIDSSLECDYLHSRTPLIPHAFTSEQAELVHINEQISLLDNHISQLNSLRHALHDRSHQLRNSLSPIHSLPVEVLSHIFKLATEQKVFYHPQLREYHRCLRQAFVLSSVSAHFRHVAFGTPELWKRIPLEITVGREMDQLASLLQHCVGFAHMVDISVEGSSIDDELDRLAIETPGLFTYDATRRIRSFELTSVCGIADVWQQILKGPSFPMLDTLSICGPDLTFDLGTLRTVTRLEIRNECGDMLIVMPPSLRYLFLENVGPRDFVPLLSYCPDLEECLAYGSGLYFDDWQTFQFNKPLTLAHLKRLTLSFTPVVVTPRLLRYLRLPSLKYLRLQHCDEKEFDGFLPFCRNVLATLTTLKLQLFGRTLAHHLHQLCRLSLPNLKKLGIAFTNTATMQDVISALTERAEECSEDQMHYLPSLEALTLCYDDYRHDDVNQMVPPCLLDLLEKWRVGETSYFHLKVKGPWYFGFPDRSPAVKEEELRSVVGNRQIGITWNGRKVH